jgi:chorismate dehydratase
VPTIGLLPFLNVKPLSYLLEREPLPTGWNLVYAPPSRLAGMLREGDICTAPVSSFACFANPKLSIVPGVCIASHGKVTSVLVFSKKPIRDVSTIALDSGSLSGASMLKVILAERYGTSPRFVSHDPDVDSMLVDNDACLMLGNKAMQYNELNSHGLNVMDLGQEWLELTGLPAVFAVWAVTKDAPLNELIPLLMRSKEQGIKKIEEIAALESDPLGLPYHVCRDYLAGVMVYDLGEAEKESLRVFSQKVCEHGLVDHPVQLSFADASHVFGGSE